jgi:hypothetical protein
MTVTHTIRPLTTRKNRVRFIIPVRITDRPVICEANSAGLSLRLRYLQRSVRIPWHQIVRAAEFYTHHDETLPLPFPIGEGELRNRP